MVLFGISGDGSDRPTLVRNTLWLRRGTIDLMHLTGHELALAASLVPSAVAIVAILATHSEERGGLLPVR